MRHAEPVGADLTSPDEQNPGDNMSGIARFDDFIQVAGVIDMREAQLLVDCGVEYLGFPLRLPVNKEDLSERDAAAIIGALVPPQAGVVITYLDDAMDIVDFMRPLGTDIVQLHGDITAEELSRLKWLRPNLQVIKSLVVGQHPREALVAMVETLSSMVDAFITDTFDTETGASGATGKTHDWLISRQLVEISDRPVILAGGLTPENVREAIRYVRPDGVDTHSGVEDASGRKDRRKVEEFVAQARAGFAALKGSGRP